MFKPRMMLGLLFALAVPAAAQAQGFGLGIGNGAHVYVMSNDVKANSIAVLKRNFFGGLEPEQVVSTGGVGTGVGTVAPPDPLGSQNSLLLSKDGHWLFAVNAGSSQISVFRVRGDRLELADVVPSGGKYPVSLAQRDDALYVLNNGGQASVTGFRISLYGQLEPIANSTRLLGSNPPLVGTEPDVMRSPSQLEFSPDGDWLVVTVKNVDSHGNIQLFAVDDQGELANQATITPSSDQQPFGFAFDRHEHLLVSEASGGAVSSYTIGKNGALSTLSASVKNGQAATCWLAAGANYAYTANAGSNTLSAYRVDRQGQLQLLNTSGVVAYLGNGHAPTDTKVSADGHFLDVLSPGTGSVSSFLIGNDGKLLFISEVPLFAPLSGAQGLAAS